MPFYHIKTPGADFAWAGEIEIDGANTWLLSPKGEQLASVLSRHIERVSESQYCHIVKLAVWAGETAFSVN